jgi:membrane protein DedA with SNARE-associated domain
VPFFLYSTIGTVIWTTFLTYSGYLLGANYKLVEEFIDPLSKIVLLILGVAFGTFLFRRWQGHDR